jgi:hypothetical protein
MMNAEWKKKIDEFTGYFQYHFNALLRGSAVEEIFYAGHDPDQGRGFL